MTKFRRPRIKHYTRRLGALERRAFRLDVQKRFLRTALGDGLHFFHRPSEITDVLRRFDELGLSDLLEPPPDIELEGDGYLERLESLFNQKSWWSYAMKMANSQTRICAAVGAKAASIETFGEDDPVTWREFGEREGEAWFLTNFADFYSQQNASGADIDHRLRWAHALGRLLEWWRWRREGHDADAVRGEDFDPKRPRRRTGRSPSRQKLRRNDNIIQRAQKLLQMGEARFASSGKINISSLADLVIVSLKLDIKDTRVKEIIREALHDGKLTD